VPQSAVGDPSPDSVDAQSERIGSLAYLEGSVRVIRHNYLCRKLINTLSTLIRYGIVQYSSMFKNIHPQDNRKFSTVPRESLWWRAHITKDDLRWVKQNLGRALDGIKAFATIPPSLRLTDGPLGGSWDKRVEFVDGETAPRINVPIGEKYDYRREYERARRDRDPHLSPHGLFRALENGFHLHALQFMQQFGPLTWKPRTLTGSAAEWISLSDFWDKHARFVGVSLLWEARSDKHSLKEAWRWVYERREQIDRTGPASFGSVPLWEVDTYSPLPEGLPWERKEGFEARIDDLVDFGAIQRLSLEVVQNELNMHTAECRQIWLMKSIGNSAQDVALQPTRGFVSLWGAIWDLFGQDASSLTHSWRVCLECGRLFYPKDCRSVCCTTEHQALWSKRRWAREHRRPKLLSKDPRYLRPKKRTGR
jgi:hypothetical protein